MQTDAKGAYNLGRDHNYCNMAMSSCKKRFQTEGTFRDVKSYPQMGLVRKYSN
jgi:hypothetical protein